LKIDLKIEPLKPHHDRSAFDYGVAGLNTYLQRYARQNASRDLGMTYVGVEAPEETRILGYYTLATGSVARDVLPEPGLPQYPVPTVLLARLAVDLSCQGKGMGGLLLANALHQALQTSALLGVFAVEVVALDETAHAFYVRHGFLPLADDPLHLYLPLKTLRSMAPPT
jgi:GNAT superfamily N-acetyltransferase